MHSFTTATLAVLLSLLARSVSAHPSPFDPRTQSPKNLHIPISELLVGSKIESSGTGSQKTDVYSVPASDITKRIPIGHPCPNEPCCKKLGDYFTQEYRWTTKSWTQHLGATRRISEAICPPGSVTNSRTVSYSYSINVQVGPDLKFGPDILDKFGIRVGFAYTWGYVFGLALSNDDNTPATTMSFYDHMAECIRS